MPQISKTKFKKTEIGMIPEDWEVKGLGEIGTLKNGVNYNRNDIGNGLKVVSVKQLFRGELVSFKDLDSVRKDRISNYDSYLLKEGDLLFARGSLKRDGAGKLALVVNLPEKDIVFSGFIIRFRNTSDNNVLFLNYLLRSAIYRELFPRIAVGTTISNLNQEILSNVPIIIPSILEQKAIAHILLTLDGKIELLQKQNKTLEEIGKVIFKKWFIDGKKDDWKVGKLGELGKIQPGFAFKSQDFLESGVGLAKIRSIQNSIIDLNFESYLPEELFNKTNEKLHLRSGDVLIAMTGAKIGKVGIIPKTNKKILLNQRVGKVDSKNKYLIYLILNTPEIQGLISGGSSASSAQENISNSDIENFDHIIPPKEIIEKVNKIINPLFEKIVDNLGSIQTLSQIRDTLLPKLMSGKIRILLD